MSAGFAVSRVVSDVISVLLLLVLCFGEVKAEELRHAALHAVGDRVEANENQCLGVEPSALDRLRGSLGGVSGGAGRSEFVVTSILDDEAGRAQGSLRQIMREVERKGGGIVRFGETIANQVILLQNSISVPSNTTIDGDCAITLSTKYESAILRVKGTKNVEIRGLRLRQGGDAAANRGDCISVQGAADQVLIIGNRFGRCGDGQIDVTRPKEIFPVPVTRVIIASNIFGNHDKAIGIGTQSCVEPICLTGVNKKWDWTEGIHVSIVHNLFYRTGQRHPRVSGRVYVYMSENLIVVAPFRRTAGNYGAAGGAYVGNGARMLANRNVFVNLSSKNVYAICASGSDACRVAHPQGLMPVYTEGYVRQNDNIIVGDLFISEHRGSDVPDPEIALGDACNRVVSKDVLSKCIYEYFLSMIAPKSGGGTGLR